MADISEGICTCYDCEQKRKKEKRFLEHSFYREVKEFSNEIEEQQILKGAFKYKNPFSPDDWSVEELANHAMSENRDQAVYITGMRHRMRKQEEEIKYLKQRLEMVTELNSKMSKAVDFWMRQADEK